MVPTRFRSIRSKLIVMFFVVAALPLLALGAAAPLLFGRSVERQNTLATLKMITLVGRSIDANVREMEYLIGFVAKEEAVSAFLGGDDSRDAEAQRLLEHLRESRPDVAGLLVVSSDDRTLSARLARVSRDALTAEPWFRTAMDEPDTIHLQARPVGRNLRSLGGLSADDVVTVTKAVRLPGRQEPAGVILVDLKLSALEGLFAQSTMEDQGFLCVADPRGQFVWAPPIPTAYRLDSSWFFAPSHSVVGRVEGQQYQILSQTSTYTRWSTIGVFSLTQALKEVTFLQYATLALSAAALILAAFAAVLFTAWFSRPVLALRATMKRAEDGDLSARFDHGPEDEIGQLGDSFNTMLAEIQNLLDQVWAEQKSKQEAELKTLQAQIKPHFLYNTLDTIQWMAVERGAEDIQVVVGALSDLFRIGLSRGQDEIPLDRELDHVRGYLIIQKTRYEDGLEYRVDSPGALGRRPVLKLVLQPLVENAIYHGIKEAGRPGLVTVSARTEGDDLVLTVQDNGRGMSQARLADVRQRLEAGPSQDWDGESSGYGIYSVHARVRLRYGPGFGLTLSSRLDEGTVAEVRLPGRAREAS